MFRLLCLALMTALPGHVRGGVPEHFVQVTDGLYTGAEPVSAAHFQALAARGVKVVVSVDGARPRVDAARETGLRYIHLPFGYDGVPRATQLGLIRVMQEASGPVYIHCHHGRHRGPAAAAIAARAAGRLDAEEARGVLQRCGTSSNYAGLWRDVAGFQAIDENESLPELTAVAEVGGLVEHMAALDRIWDQLKKIKAAGWVAPNQDPDAAPAHQALIVREHLVESARLDELADQPELVQALREAVVAAHHLEQALRADDLEAVESAYLRMRKDCRSCHSRWRSP